MAMIVPPMLPRRAPMAPRAAASADMASLERSQRVALRRDDETVAEYVLTCAGGPNLAAMRTRPENVCRLAGEL
eukprot:scaffold638753_cov14-Prasinocladus_malaysianus.AAC.1